MHETAYGNSLKKIQHANKKLIELREKITKYDAELKMSAAEAEIAKLSETFNINLTTDFGQIESVIQQQHRPEPRQGARRGRPVARGHRRDRGRGADAERSSPRRRSRTSRSSSGCASPETTPVVADGEGSRPGDREADELATEPATSNLSQTQNASTQDADREHQLWQTDSPDRHSTSRFCSS